MNPYESTLVLKNSLISYFKRTFPLEKSLDSQNDQAQLLTKMDDFLNADDTRLVQPPFIERQIPYKQSSDSLNNIGLEEETARAFARYFDSTVEAFHPYIHQENAFREVTSGNNLIVCTGTGSGKTESFLLPVINEIVKERKNNGVNYMPGVRALILYPMNALVNDQIRRLRSIIRNISNETLRPTFGLYTSVLKSHEEKMDYTNARNVWQNNHNLVYVQDNNVDYANDDIALPCEYTHRYQWNNAPADILVTNYPMLERLLLDPLTSGIFTNTWRFIVLDEAHSYTGSMGTEIAWLVRRLVHRTGSNNLQFIATSATLRKPDAEDTLEDNKQWIKDNFASKIFPAEADTFTVELGEEADPDTTEQQPFEGDLARLLEDHKEDFDAMVNLLAVEKSHQADLALMPYLGKNEYSVDELAFLIDHFPDLQQDANVIEVNDTIRVLINFVFAFFGNDRNNWASRLHDDLSPLDSDIQDAQGRNLHEGNQLHILDAWQEAVQNQNENQNARLTAEQFSKLVFYAYQAANEIPDFNVELGKLQVVASNDFVGTTTEFKGNVNNQTPVLVNQRVDLTNRWCDLLSGRINCKLEEMLFERLCNRFDTQYLLENVKGYAKSFLDVARELYDDRAVEKLFALLQLAMIARQGGVRHPLLDIRYHQLIRGISDVAVYFPNGDIQSLSLIRSADFEHEGYSLFALGVCRECGHPYLMGYTPEPNLNGDGRLMRNFTAQSAWLQVFSWAPGNDTHAMEKGREQAECDGVNHQNPPDSNGPIFINLRTGEYSLAPQEGYTQMYWHRHPKIGGEDGRRYSQFITTCPNCGCWRTKSDKQTYGIITPYTAVSEQLQLEILMSFAKQAEIDTDPRLQNMPGGGRKILAFSDSRSGAAKLAYKFHHLFLQRFLINQIASIVADSNNFIGRPARYENFLQMLPYIHDMLLPGLNIDEEFPREQLPSSFLRVANVLLNKMKEKKFDYFLEISDEQDPTRLLVANAAAQWLTMRALRDLSRQSLIGGQKIILEYDFESHKLSQTINDWNLSQLIPNNDQRNQFIEAIKQLLQKIFRFLFTNCKLVKPHEWPAVDEHEDWHLCIAQNAQYQDGYTEVNGFFPASGRTNRISSFLDEAIGQTGVNLDDEQKKSLLGSIWTYLTNQSGLLVPVENNAQDYCLSLLSGQGQAPQLTEQSILANAMILKPVDNHQQNAEDDFPLRIEEHTAQLSSTRGSNYQKAFATGRINILSCSTTFEMGIDLGSLNRVFLANMPPATANYKQRAGRAGRRPGAAPYILTFAGNQAHDIYYFEHPTELFDGNITPPQIYLEKPTFRARHLRAEALHDFLDYWTRNHPQLRNGYNYWRDWTKINVFFLHYEATALEGHEGNKTARINRVGSPIINDLGNWLDQREAAVKNYIQQIKDVPNLDYSVPKDLIFQLKGDNPPYEMIPRNKRRFLELCGPCLPEVNNDELQLNNDNPMRHCALRRVKSKFIRLRSDDASPEDGFIHNGNVLKMNGAQRFYIYSKGEESPSSIDVFSSYSILPKYGFPVDVIELMLPKNDRNKNNISLERPLRIGLFEYAPGQIVFADKHCYKSSSNVHFHGSLALDYRQCPRCYNFTDRETCPNCGDDCQTVQNDNLSFIRPEAFVATANADSSIPEGRGVSQQIYGGDILAQLVVPRLHLSVGESDTQMMRYTNAGPKGDGFELNHDEQHNYVFVHEIITNIAIWEIPANAIPAFGDPKRAANAVLSAMYAIREAAAIKLQISSRDIGALLEPQQANGAYRIILLDQSAGGGGLVLPLYDANNDRLIRSILEKAKEICINCHCASEIIDHQPGTSVIPVTEGEYRNRQQNAGPNGIVNNFRPRASCPLCLKKQDNIWDHHKLDRWDAALVMDKVLEPSYLVEWIDVPEGYVVRDGRRYRLDDGSEILLDRRHHPEQRDLIHRIRQYINN